MKKKLALFSAYTLALCLANYFVFDKTLEETFFVSVLTAAVLTAMDNFMSKVTKKIVTVVVKKIVKQQ